MDDMTITTDGVQKLLDDLNVYKPNRPDGILARILKETSKQVTEGMTLLFKASFTQSDISNTWRETLIPPLFKGGKKYSKKALNCITVRQASISCKVLEHVLYSNVMKHLEKNNIVKSPQHGFRKYPSCEAQLINTLNDPVKSINHGELIDSILLEFCKGLDLQISKKY